MCVAVRAEADKGDSQSQQTQEKCNAWRILGYIISKVGHRLPESHDQTSQTSAPSCKQKSLKLELELELELELSQIVSTVTW